MLRARRTWWDPTRPATPMSVTTRHHLVPAAVTLRPRAYGRPRDVRQHGVLGPRRSYRSQGSAHPYTFKKYIAVNSFRWIDEGSGRRSQSATTARRRATPSSSSRSPILGTHPRTVSAQRDLPGQQRYTGWKVRGLANPRAGSTSDLYEADARERWWTRAASHPPPPRTGSSSAVSRHR